MKKFILILTTCLLLCTSCGILTQLNQTTELTKCNFNLGDLAGIDIAGIHISKVTDLTPVDLAKIGSSLIAKSVPVGINLNISVQNTGNRMALLNSFQWICAIDGVDMFQGTVTSNNQIPSKSTKLIPFGFTIDLYKMFSKNGINAVKAFVSSYRQGKISDSISLRVKPSITVSGAQMYYPSYIKIL